MLFRDGRLDEASGKPAAYVEREEAVVERHERSLNFHRRTPLVLFKELHLRLAKVCGRHCRRRKWRSSCETSKPTKWVIDQLPVLRITRRRLPDRDTIGSRADRDYRMSTYDNAST